MQQQSLGEGTQESKVKVFHQSCWVVKNPIPKAWNMNCDRSEVHAVTEAPGKGAYKFNDVLEKSDTH